MQSVTITKKDDGSYEVSSGADMPGKPEPDLQSALMAAAKMLEQPEQQMSPFDQGMQRAMPVNGSMGKMGM